MNDTEKLRWYERAAMDGRLAPAGTTLERCYMCDGSGERHGTENGVTEMFPCIACGGDHARRINGTGWLLVPRELAKRQSPRFVLQDVLNSLENAETVSGYLVYQMRSLPEAEFQELPWRETPMAFCGLFDDLELARACAHECATPEYVAVVDRLVLNESLGPEIVPKPEMRILNVDHLGDEWGPAAVRK